MIKKILLIFFCLFFFLSGFSSGFLLQDYKMQEKCLDFEFKDSENVLSEEEKQEIIKKLNAKSEEDSKKETQEEPAPDQTLVNNFVGSANSDKFYPADCHYAKRIKEENKVWFESKEEGERQGRTFVDC